MNNKKKLATGDEREQCIPISKGNNDHEIKMRRRITGKFEGCSNRPAMCS